MMSSVPSHFNIIMIEDDLGHARLIRKNLERAGICNPILHFDNGKDAMNFFINDTDKAYRDKSLVLLDLNLPEIDGYEILKRLKSSEDTKSMPIIVLTTTDNPREVDKCYELGCNVYITKPVEYDNFSEAIKRLGFMLSIVKLPHIPKCE